MYPIPLNTQQFISRHRKVKLIYAKRYHRTRGVFPYDGFYKKIPCRFLIFIADASFMHKYFLFLQLTVNGTVSALFCISFFCFLAIIGTNFASVQYFASIFRISGALPSAYESRNIAWAHAG